MNLATFDKFNIITSKLVSFWALMGGIILIILAFITFLSTLSNMLFNAPFNGDFEITELGSMIVIFSFLPLCEFKKGNILVDFFTKNSPQKFKNITSFTSTFLMLAFSIILFTRMFYGMVDYYDETSPEATMILTIPIWLTYIPALLSLLLLIFACLNNLIQLTLNPNALKANISDDFYDDSANKSKSCNIN